MCVLREISLMKTFSDSRGGLITPPETSSHLLPTFKLFSISNVFICMCACVVPSVSVAWYNIYVENCVIISPVYSRNFIFRDNNKFSSFDTVVNLISFYSRHLNYISLPYGRQNECKKNSKSVFNSFSPFKNFYLFDKNFFIFPEIMNVMFVFMSRNNSKKNISINKFVILFIVF